MTFVESLGNSIRNGFCTVAQTAQDFGVTADVSVDYRGFSVGVNLIRLAQRLTCNREPSPGYAPGFTGGQCPVQYDVTLLKNAIEGDGDPKPGYPDSITVRGTGPVRGFVIRQDPGSVQIIYVQFAAGVEVYAGNLNLPDEQFVDCAITSVVRVDGLPDNCGNPIPTVPPSEPGSRTTNINFTYTDSSSNDIDIDASVTFGDIVTGINGDINIPFQVTYDDILPFTFNGTLNLNTGGITINPGNKGYPPTKNPNGDNFNSEDNPETLPDVPNDVIPPSANDNEPEVRRIIRGVFVTTVADESRGTVIDQLDTPDIIAPNLGFIQFAIAVSNKVGWTVDIPVKNHRFFCECPWIGGAIDVRGTPRAGVEWIITPVYANEEKSQTFD